MELIIEARIKPEPKHKKNCICEECNGTGEITCPECDGTGEIESDEEMPTQEVADQEGLEWQLFWLSKRYGTATPSSIRDYWLRRGVT